jgi:hypothetical protein
MVDTWLEDDFGTGDTAWRFCQFHLFRPKSRKRQRLLVKYVLADSKVYAIKASLRTVPLLPV